MINLPYVIRNDNLELLNETIKENSFNIIVNNLEELNYLREKEKLINDADEEIKAKVKEMKAEINFDEILLVVDSMMGQDAVNMALKFNELLEIN